MMTRLGLRAAGAVLAALLPMTHVAATEAGGGASLVVTVQPAPAVLRYVDPGAAVGSRARRTEAWRARPYSDRSWSDWRLHDPRGWDRLRGRTYNWDAGRRYGRPDPYADGDRGWQRYGTAPRRYDRPPRWRGDSWARRSDWPTY